MLCDKKVCTGCGVCANRCPVSCIEMVYDWDGFLYPQINEASCVQCGACSAVCPVLHPQPVMNLISPVCYSGWNKDPEVRSGSTSGGIFSVFAAHIFSLGGSVCGVALGKNNRPYHFMADSPEEIGAMRGSKYLQSHTGTIYGQVKEALKSGRHVLFAGCPCQVGGLYAFLGGDEERLLTCEVICHGVASASVFDRYMNYLEEKLKASVVEVYFRTKKYGWTTSAMEFILSNGTSKVVKAKNNLFLKAFYSGLCIRNSCLQCRYASLPRVADISIGDYWHAVVQDFPKKDLQRGISLILLNNAKALKVFSEVQQKSAFQVITLQEATADNTNISGLGKANLKREAFFAEYSTAEVSYLMKKYFPSTLKSKLGNLFGKRWTRKLKSAANIVFGR